MLRNWLTLALLLLPHIALAEPVQQPVFVAGEEGYKIYRIPGLVVAKDGSVLAFCEGRKNGPADHGDIDLVLKRSQDGGRTWSKLAVVHDDGEHTIGNPCPVVDRRTGTIWLPFCRDNDRVFMTSSTDNGQSWQPPVDITGKVKEKDWGWYATGPGHGIQMRSGRLVIPCDHRVGETKYSHVFYSDDAGKTWQLGGSIGTKMNECEAVELADGRLLLNMRSYRGLNRRAITISNDGGETWGEIQNDEQLIEPVCQASILRYSFPGDGQANRVLFSNPASKRRERLTVRLSTDDCQTWSDGRVLHAGPSGYSELATLPDGTILCLYEKGEKDYRETISLARFELEWLTAAAE